MYQKTMLFSFSDQNLSAMIWRLQTAVWWQTGIKAFPPDCHWNRTGSYGWNRRGGCIVGQHRPLDSHTVCLKHQESKGLWDHHTPCKSSPAYKFPLFAFWPAGQSVLSPGLPTLSTGSPYNAADFPKHLPILFSQRWQLSPQLCLIS